MKQKLDRNIREGNKRQPPWHLASLPFASFPNSALSEMFFEKMEEVAALGVITLDLAAPLDLEMGVAQG